MCANEGNRNVSCAQKKAIETCHEHKLKLYKRAMCANEGNRNVSCAQMKEIETCRAQMKVIETCHVRK